MGERIVSAKSYQDTSKEKVEEIQSVKGQSSKETEVEKFLREKCSKDNIDNAVVGDELEEILEKVIEFASFYQNPSELEEKVEEIQPIQCQLSEEKKEKSAILSPEKKHVFKITEIPELSEMTEMPEPLEVSELREVLNCCPNLL